MDLTGLDYLAAGGAAAVAGAVNALAGGGTLISFPTLVGLGVPAVGANVTNTVSLLPGYLAGSWAQRDDLRPQLKKARVAMAMAAVGGLVGSVLLVVIPAHAFRVAVPYLILAACALLYFQDRLRQLVSGTRAAPGAAAGTRPVQDDVGTHHGVPLVVLIFAASIYGGFFGAGLGIMLLALIGLFSSDPLAEINALKQALSFVVNLVAAAFFAFSGHVVWDLVPVMAAASLIGGWVGGRLVKVIDPNVLRRIVVIAGVAVAISFWVT